jgi:hypothetical protein
MTDQGVRAGWDGVPQSNGLQHSAQQSLGRIAGHQPGAELPEHGGVIASIGKFLD